MDRTDYKYNLEYRAAVRAKLASSATDFIEGKLGLIATARDLGRLGDGFEPALRQLLDVFAVIFDETDGLPIGAERALWNAQALVQEDKKILLAEERWRDEAIAAAIQLVHLLKQNS